MSQSIQNLKCLRYLLFVRTKLMILNNWVYFTVPAQLLSHLIIQLDIFLPESSHGVMKQCL